MRRVVAIHGINNTYRGPHQMANVWVPALLDGVVLAGGSGLLSAEGICCVTYGDIFRAPGRTLGHDDAPPFDAEDVEDGFERELLLEWWAAAAAVDPGVAPPGARSLSASRSVQAALAALSCSRFLADISERLLIFWLKQVRLYFTEPAIRSRIQDRLAAAISPDTRVVVAHSLGSAVAYEAICAHPEWPITTLVTLGSPLGVRNLVFDRLIPPPRPAPDSGRLRGNWPAQVTFWTNIADAHDFVALVKTLRPCFGDQITDIETDNGMLAHDVARYLSDSRTGTAVIEGLRNG